MYALFNFIQYFFRLFYISSDKYFSFDIFCLYYLFFYLGYSSFYWIFAHTHHFFTVCRKKKKLTANSRTVLEPKEFLLPGK